MGQATTPETPVESEATIAAIRQRRASAIALYGDHPAEDLRAPLLPSVANRLERAGELRTHAAALPGPAAAAFRRRAAELELEAFLLQTKYDHLAHTPLRATS